MTNPLFTAEDILPKLSAALAELESLRNEVTSLRKQLAWRHCPSCGEEVMNGVGVKMVDELEALRAQNLELSADVAHLTHALQKADDYGADLEEHYEEQLSDLREENEAYRVATEITANALTDLKQEVTSLRARNVQLEQQIESDRHELVALRKLCEEGEQLKAKVDAAPWVYICEKNGIKTAHLAEPVDAKYRAKLFGMETIPEQIVLSDRDFERLEKELKNPSEPNEALKRLFRTKGKGEEK